MKKTITRFAAVVLLGLTAVTFTQCDKVKGAIKINVPMTMEYDFVIPETSNTEEISLTNALEMNVDSLIKSANEKLGVHNIKAATIETVVIAIDPASQSSDANFTNLDYISEHFYSDLKSEKVKIAEVTEFTNPYDVDLVVNNPPDLKEYFESKVFYFDTKAKLNNPITQPIKAKAKIKMILKVGL